MKITEYLKRLFHSISRNQITASCDKTIDSIQKHTLPAYVTAAGFFKEHKLSSDESADFITGYKTKVGLKGGQNIVESIHDVLQRTMGLLQSIGERSDALFADVESTIGMTFQKATYLRLISSASFANDYARQFLNYLYAAETSKLAPSDNPLANTLTPAERKYVEANFDNFCVIMAILAGDQKDVMEAIDDLPDAIVSEKSEQTLLGSLGSRKLDPLGFNNLIAPVTLSVRWNPFYLIGILVADFQVAQYKAADDEVSLLGLRRLNLEKLHAKKPDARLQQEIDYLANRVSKARHTLMTMEQKYAV